MKYYKNIENDYIVSISTQQGQIEITRDEYEGILFLVKIAPREEGFVYKLKENLSWDRVEVEYEETEEDFA